MPSHASSDAPQHIEDSSHEPLYCGVDIGASATKLVLANRSGHVLARIVRPSGVDYRATAKSCLHDALALLGDQATVERTLSTGYGRRNVDFADDSVTEIHCHGVGCYHLVPRQITVVDIGGQDNKVILLDADGKRVDFKMNRKCAAGTGAFLEEIAVRLGLKPEELDPLAQRAEKTVRLSSFCTVFAKTEILAHLRKGESVEGIVRGAFVSVVNRIVEMAPLGGEVVLTGGVAAHNPTVREILADKIGKNVIVPPEPQFTGALGAAILAAR